MLTKRIIPCLDVKNGRTVKGVNFVNLIDAGDPVALAQKYADQGADELVFLDISATKEERATTLDLVKKVGAKINIPYSVGGGISSVDQVYTLLQHGAEKVSINSSAVSNPQLVTEISEAFGSQCLIVAVDARKEGDQWMLYTHGGSKSTEIELFGWVEKMEKLGAGEILFTSMDHDGTRSGFAIKALQEMNSRLSIPVIASGGAGMKEHFKEAFEIGMADATLAASIFHFGEVPLPELKTYLKSENIPVRV